MKKRPRINRWTPARRDLLFSPSLRNSFVQPHFVVSGTGVDNPISSMPGISRQSVDVLCKTIESDMELGIRAHMLFGVVDDEDKDPMATKASDSSMPLQTAVRQLKSKFGSDIVVMTDVCLCTATDHGHCGVIHNHEIDNDSTIPELVKIALSHAEAGADYVSASDMMDGRVKAIRKALEIEGFTSTGILSYSVKYASSFYGPFRDALDSAPKAGDKKTYQMDPRNKREALIEAELDELEGADFLMVKPALSYLDVIQTLSENSNLPISAYNVSGEYAMVHAAAEKGWLDYENTYIEILTSIKRAGADMILSYFAKDFVKR